MRSSKHLDVAQQFAKHRSRHYLELMYHLVYQWQTNACEIWHFWLSKVKELRPFYLIQYCENLMMPRNTKYSYFRWIISITFVKFLIITSLYLKFCNTLKIHFIKEKWQQRHLSKLNNMNLKWIIKRTKTKIKWCFLFSVKFAWNFFETSIFFLG